MAQLVQPKKLIKQRFKLKKNLLLSKLNVVVIILIFSFVFAGAAKAPRYKPNSVHGMGGAFVAVADDRNAIYYNPAGLNLMNRLGDFKRNPDMGYMDNKSFELRLFTVSTMLPGDMITDVIDICGAPNISKMIKKTLLFDFSYFGNVEWCPVYEDIIPDNMEDLPDALQENQELSERLVPIDNKPIEIGTQVSILEFAMHNFGFAIWTNTAVTPYATLGTIVPSFGYEAAKIDVAVQTAFAFSPAEKWSVGAGLKVAKRAKLEKYYFAPEFTLKGNNPDLIYQKELDSLEDIWNNFAEDSILNFDNIQFGLDFGVLYQVTREIRVGSSLRDVYFGELAGETITPNLSFGAMASPMILQSNSLWGRKVNFALDYVDVLDGTLTSMFFSHLNFGAEIEQVVIPSLTKELSTGYKVLFALVGGAAGFGIGYLLGDGLDIFAGSLIGGGVGALAGIKFGSSGEALRVSAGGGFEGGYPAFNLGFGLFGETFNMNFASYAEERGTRTGQKEHRIWAGEVSVGF